MIRDQEHRHKLYNVALSLINDGDFYVDYTKKALGRDSYARREAILQAKRRGVYDASLTADEREQVRRYIDNYWNLTAAQGDSSFRDRMATFELDPSVEFEVALDAYHADSINKKPATPPANPTPKEIPMTAIIKIETKTFANGVDISTMSDSAIYDLIASQEKKIKELEAISAKPKKLKKEIADRQEGITALVVYLDSKA